MKKVMGKCFGLLLSALMVLSPAVQAMAANQFDVTAEDVAGKLIFPGDSIYGVEPIYVGPDGTAAEVVDGVWTNRTDQAYEMGALEGEDGLWLQPMGYVLTVNGGTSKLSDKELDGSYNHFEPKEQEPEDEEKVTKDVAYFEEWTDVTVTADEPKEGKVFDHWEVEDNAISLEDATAAEIQITMIDKAVVLNAVYADAPMETETEEAVTEPVYAETELTVPADDPVEENYGEETWPTEDVTGSVDDQSGIVAVGEDVTDDTEVLPEQPADQTYQLTVENGYGSGEYEVGTNVTITAEEIEGMAFAGWVTEADTVWFADSMSPETTFFMPAESVVVGATYTEEEDVVIEPEETETEAVENNAAEGDPIVPDLYYVEVEAGEGEGAYEAGANVTVYADEAPEGTVFTGWTVSENVVLNDASAEEATFVMPAENVKLAANYEVEEPETETEELTEQAASETETESETVETETEAVTEQAAEETTYRVDLSDTSITVEGAELVDGQYYAKAGDVITVSAQEYEDQTFHGWKVTRSDSQAEVPVAVEEDDLVTTFTMPESIVYVEALYEQIIQNEVQVVNGSGSGTYVRGNYVEIEADKAPEGQRFKEWTVITGDVILEDSKSSITGFTMPEGTVQVKAVYEVIKYTLTVNNGSGSGSYVKGDKVSLTANYPASGKEFAEWKVTSGKGAVSAPDRYYSSLTMPAANVTVEATYKDGPSPDYNEIQNIVSGGEYLKGSTLSFTAVGNGMSNTNPNPGDYRYRPTGYQIGSVSGSWNDERYTTSMAINAVGQYTLTVTFSKDVFDGTTWVADGTTATKSVTFNVVNALSVQTGDNSPILPLAIAAVVALGIIILVLVLRARKKR